MKEQKVLLGFTSTHGATEEVARFVADILRGAGLAVDVKPLKTVRSLSGYQAVIVGAPIYMFHLHRAALRFLGRFEEPLRAGLPLALFAGGPFGEDKPEAWQEIRRQLEAELAQFAWLKPAAVELIGGRFDPARLRFPWQLLPYLRQQPPSDLRNWDAIRDWASGLPAPLRLVETVGASA